MVDPASSDESTAPGTDESSATESDEETDDRLEEEYDFSDFGPADMDRMSAEEWDEAFDPESWITGEELLDRVEADLERRVAERDVFAIVERIEVAEGGRIDEAILAYADAGYAIVFADGSVEGDGAVLRDVKPSVALCSMPEYEVEEPPEDASLPHPEDVPEGTGALGHRMLQLIAGMLLLSGLGMVGAAIIGRAGASPAIVVTAGLIFLGMAFFLTLMVVNARLSDRFRAEEYRNRLRGAGVGSDERPAWLPLEGDRLVVEPDDHRSIEGGPRSEHQPPDDTS